MGSWMIPNGSNWHQSRTPDSVFWGKKDELQWRISLQGVNPCSWCPYGPDRWSIPYGSPLALVISVIIRCSIQWHKCELSSQSGEGGVIALGFRGQESDLWIWRSVMRDTGERERERQWLPIKPVGTVWRLPSLYRQITACWSDKLPFSLPQQQQHRILSNTCRSTICKLSCPAFPSPLIPAKLIGQKRIQQIH